MLTIKKGAKVAVLEGVELEGKIGTIGEYKVDVKKDATAVASIQVSEDLVKELIPGITVFVKGGAAAGANVDIVAAILAFAAKSPNNAVLKYLAMGAKAYREIAKEEAAAVVVEAPKA